MLEATLSVSSTPSTSSTSPLGRTRRRCQNIPSACSTASTQRLRIGVSRYSSSGTVLSPSHSTRSPKKSCWCQAVLGKNKGIPSDTLLYTKGSMHAKKQNNSGKTKTEGTYCEREGHEGPDCYREQRGEPPGGEEERSEGQQVYAVDGERRIQRGDVDGKQHHYKGLGFLSRLYLQRPGYRRRRIHRDSGGYATSGRARKLCTLCSRTGNIKLKMWLWAEAHSEASACSRLLAFMGVPDERRKNSTTSQLASPSVTRQPNSIGFMNLWPRNSTWPIYVPTARMLADGFTKALSKPADQKLCRAMGLVGSILTGSADSWEEKLGSRRLLAWGSVGTCGLIIANGDCSTA